MNYYEGGLGASLLSIALYARKRKYSQLERAIEIAARKALSEIPEGFEDHFLLIAANVVTEKDAQDIINAAMAYPREPEYHPLPGEGPCDATPSAARNRIACTPSCFSCNIFLVDRKGDLRADPDN